MSLDESDWERMYGKTPTVYEETKMTKLTALDLYILTDTLLHSLSFDGYWTGSATKEGRDGVLKKLQRIMSEMEVSTEN